MFDQYRRSEEDLMSTSKSNILNFIVLTISILMALLNVQFNYIFWLCQRMGEKIFLQASIKFGIM